MYGQLGMTGQDDLFGDVTFHTPMELTDDAFGHCLQGFLSNSQADLAASTGMQEQTTQQWSSVPYSAVTDARHADWQQQPSTSYSEHPAPLDSSADWSPSNPFSNPYYQRPPVEVPEAIPSGTAPTVEASASDDRSIQQSTQEAHEGPKNNREPGPYRSKRAIKRAALEANNIEFGNDFRKKGVVEYKNGELYVLYRGRIKLAVYRK